MAGRASIWLEKALHRGGLSRWSAVARSADTLELSALKHKRQMARQLADQLDQVIHVADSRLAMPRIGSQAFNRPKGTQWAWRPQLWRGPVTPTGIAGATNRSSIGDELVLFHDCPASELTLRQIRNTREEDLAPFALQIDVFSFQGSFLSLVLDLPPDAVDGLRRRHLIRLSAAIEAEAELDVFARLNVQHGPNTEKLVQKVSVGERDTFVEFDLAYSDLNEKRLDKMWVDLIFEAPQMNQLVIRDLTFCRYPRAEL